MLFWQNILNNRQIPADIEEELANQGEAFRGGISRFYLSLLNKWNPCHGAINSSPSNLRTALEKHFQFHWNCKQLLFKARNSMSSCEIYFPIFSEALYIKFWKYFHSMVLGSVGRGHCKKFGVRIFSQNFWLGYLSAFNVKSNFLC